MANDSAGSWRSYRDHGRGWGFCPAERSKDAALLLYLLGSAPQVSGVNATTGVALVEVYEVP